MCYNYNIKVYSNIAEFEQVFRATFKDETIKTTIEDYYYVNAFSFPVLPVITNEDPKHFQMYTWGLIPFWVKKIEDAEILSKEINNIAGVVENGLFIGLTSEVCVGTSEGAKTIRR